MEFTKRRTDKASENEEGELKNVHPMKNMHPDPKLSGVMDRLCKLTDEEDRTGSITYLGVFTSGERGVYAVKPHRVQGIIMLLAGISDLVDTMGVY